MTIFSPSWVRFIARKMFIEINNSKLILNPLQYHTEHLLDETLGSMHLLPWQPGQMCHVAGSEGRNALPGLYSLSLVINSNA